MTEECGMIWLSHVENYAFVAASLGSVLTAIYLVPFVCGLTALLALRVALLQLVNVVAWEVLAKRGYHYYL